MNASEDHMAVDGEEQNGAPKQTFQVNQPNAQQDHMMEGDSMSTVTPGIAYGNAQPPESRPYTSYSDTGFSRPYHSDHQPSPQPFAPQPDTDTPPRNQYYHAEAQGYPPQQSSSRPGSGMAAPRYPQSDGGSRSVTYQEQNQRHSQQDPAKNNSVVIKVGMVGDAQIGKTSLMVKYVEGSWDEDYIQTLGKLALFVTAILAQPDLK